MKTVEEFYKEISSTKALQDELKNASDEMLEAFLKKHDCNASVRDFTEYVNSQKEGEIEDKDAEVVAGGLPIYGLH